MKRDLINLTLIHYPRISLISEFLLQGKKTLWEIIDL